MRTDELDFSLPPELIAQEPPARRGDSRLLHFRRGDQSVSHRTFSDLPPILRAGDLLVFNDTRVLAARFMLRKQTGGTIEGLFLEEQGPGHWRVLLKNAGRVPVGTKLWIVGKPIVLVQLDEKFDEGEWSITVSSAESPETLLSRVGRMPLPPYIRRGKNEDPRDRLDSDRYQTVFAKEPGAVAAPTAALHFSAELLAMLADHGVDRAFVTLHVGLGTFKPVTAERLEEHRMHLESYVIGEIAAEALNRAKREGRRIIAVGTTCARVLESQPEDRPFIARKSAADIFICPPYRWKHVSALVTNFHLPRSTLIALVAAMTGLEEQRRLYRMAIAEKYRFFSYGDGMLIE